MTRLIVNVFEKFAGLPEIVRTPEEQAKLDAQTRKVALYQYAFCPSCMRVRDYIRRRDLSIELKDTLHNAAVKNELVEQGGKDQVPCLRVEDNDGNVSWIYESREIIRYLERCYTLQSDPI